MKTAFLFFAIASFLTQNALAQTADGFVGHFEKNTTSTVDFLKTAKNNREVFRLKLAQCRIEGALQWIGSHYASFTNGDCFLVFQFSPDFQNVKVASKNCMKTCGAEISTSADGQYLKR